MSSTMKNRASKTGLIHVLSAFLTASICFMSMESAVAFHFPWDQGHDSTDWNDPEDPGPCDNGFCDQDPTNCSGKVGPVYVATGHLNWLDTDLTLNGRPYLGITRSYQSNDPRTGMFGNGWSFEHDKSLSVAVDYQRDRNGISRTVTKVILRAGNGKRYEWRYNVAPNVLNNRHKPTKSPTGVFVTFKFLNNGSVRLTGRDGGFETYDSLGKLLARVDRNGNRIEYQYNADGSLLRVLDENSRSLTFRYNSSGLVNSVTDHTERRWTYSYDTSGSLVDVTDPLGGVKSYEYNGFTSPADGFTYHLLTRVIDETGITVTKVEYNGRQVRSHTIGENQWSFAYSPDTNQTTRTDLASNKETFSYDSNGLIVQLVNALGFTTLTRRNNDGLVTEVIDPLGHTWKETRDRLGRILRSSDALRNVTQYNYKGAEPWPNKIVSPTGRTATYRYDKAGNLTQMKDPAGATASFSWSKKGDLLRGKNALNAGSRITYNAIGLPVSFTDEQNRKTIYAYDDRGNPTKTTNPDGDVSRLVYDDLDRVIRAHDPADNTLTSNYDAAGRLTNFTDEKGNTTSHTYDSFGRYREETGPDGRKVAYSYRVDNLISQLTLEDGIVTQYSYDQAGRMVGQDFGGDVTTFAYNRRDELVRAENSTGTVSIRYDKNGRKTKETYGTETVEYQYNKENERTRVRAVGGDTRYRRDSRGYVTAISSATTGGYRISYDAIGRRKQTSFPNGCRTDYRYDKSGQLSALKFSGGFNARYTFQRDDAGLLTNWSGAQGGAWTYEYDDNQRLVNARHGSRVQRYSYDESGNRLDNGGVYDNANRLDGNDDFDFDYDNRGRVRRKLNKSTQETTNYSWNARNQLVKVEYFAQGGGSATTTIDYTYGPFGRRWSRITNGVPETFIYDNFDRIGTKNRSGRVVQEVTFGPLIDEPLGAKTASGRRYFHSNHQGSVMGLTNNSGRTVSRATYLPYGTTTITGDRKSNDFWYTGREKDADDLYYYRARYYDPTVGRFLSEDPLGIGAGDSNLYSYAHSSPTNYTDPAGTCVPITPDVVTDVAFAGYDVHRIFKENIFGSCDIYDDHLLVLGADVAGTCIPGATGLSLGTRVAGRYGDNELMIGNRATQTAGGEASTAQGPMLRDHLRQAGRYGKGGVKEYGNARAINFGEAVPAISAGNVAGKSTIKEWNPTADDKPVWSQNPDRSGNVRQVRPEGNNGIRTHYTIDRTGN